MAEMDQTTDPGFSGSEPLENQGLQKPKTLQFEECNEVTIKVTDGRGSNAWDGYGKSYRTTRAVAWLMGIGDGKWVVRYRDRTSKPMTLTKAKRMAAEIIKGVWQTDIVTAPIDYLNRLQIPEAPRAPVVGTHVDILGGTGSGDIAPEIRVTILDSELVQPASHDAEPLQGDEPIEFDADGYAELPACLDRRKPKIC
jgi:hypothetical protein